MNLVWFAVALIGSPLRGKRPEGAGGCRVAPAGVTTKEEYHDKDGIR